MLPLDMFMSVYTEDCYWLWTKLPTNSSGPSTSVPLGCCTNTPQLLMFQRRNICPVKIKHYFELKLPEKRAKNRIFYRTRNIMKKRSDLGG